MKKILVTGANGQLGSELRALTGKYPQYGFLFTDVAELDITDRDVVAGFVDRERPDWILNAAAYTAVDKAESEPERALSLNATAVENLAAAARQTGAGLVQISTDYVFSGDDQRLPLNETHPTAPRSVYGKTKLRGEAAALACPRSLVVRTSWLYSAYGNNFVKTMMRLGGERSSLGVVADQWGSPTYAADLADTLLHMIASIDQQGDQGRWGLYHYANQGETTWFEFATEIMCRCNIDCVVNPITTTEYPTPAARPVYSVMDTRKIRERFALEIPQWDEALGRCLELLIKTQ